MLITELFNGQGLGNQLANYVTVKCLALDKGYKFGVQHPERFKGLSFMDIDFGEKVIGGNTPIEGQEPTQLPENIRYYYKEVTSSYDPKLSRIRDNTSIHGNLQGVDYFRHRKDEVRRWLKVEPLEMDKNTCVINFRGGEYKYVPEFFLPKSYWDDAVAEMLATNPNMTFEVHTDDVEEAQKFFPDYPVTHDVGLNWRSIRYAHYLILSNSSFAILPAFLNENAKRIIAPRFFGRFNVGFWHLEQNYTEGWDWMDINGKIWK